VLRDIIYRSKGCYRVYAIHKVEKIELKDPQDLETGEENFESEEDIASRESSPRVLGSVSLTATSPNSIDVTVTPQPTKEITPQLDCELTSNTSQPTKEITPQLLCELTSHTSQPHNDPL